VEALLDAGRSVLLVGPHGSGKTAIVNVVRREGLIVMDPFAGITTVRAASLRRALDRGTVVLGAACSLDRAKLGHVGRVAWRFERAYLRPLSPRVIADIIRARVDAESGAHLPIGRRWMVEAVDVAAGLPGRAVAVASMVAQRWRSRGSLLPPRLALVIAWQEGLSNYAEHLNATGVGPGSLHHECD
jgi:hypothetical protein